MYVCVYVCVCIYIYIYCIIYIYIYIYTSSPWKWTRSRPGGGAICRIPTSFLGRQILYTTTSLKRLLRLRLYQIETNASIPSIHHPLWVVVVVVAAVVVVVSIGSVFRCSRWGPWQGYMAALWGAPGPANPTSDLEIQRWKSDPDADFASDSTDRWVQASRWHWQSWRADSRSPAWNRRWPCRRNNIIHCTVLHYVILRYSISCHNIL